MKPKKTLLLIKIFLVATGRAFEVANINWFHEKYKQKSLAEIFKALWNYKYNEIISINEIRQKIIQNNIKLQMLNTKLWFDQMEAQGVMFLNASLTTTIGKSNAHFDIWKDFMDDLIKFIVSENDKIKWLIWGEKAFIRVKNIVKEENIVKTCHPASYFNNNFAKDCCFRLVSDIKWF